MRDMKKNKKEDNRRSKTIRVQPLTAKSVLNAVDAMVQRFVQVAPFYRLAIRWLNLDLWILLKSRLIMKFIIRFLNSLIQVVTIMALGAGLLAAFTLVHLIINKPIYAEEKNYIGEKSSEERVLRIETSSGDSSILQRELANLKNQALKLEMNLREMKNQYKDLSNIARSNHRDEELADFASEAAGGSVLDTPETESYYEPYNQQITIFGIPIWEANYFTPRKVIKPWTQAGECWAFKGSSGKIIVKLARLTLIERVTLEHIPVSASITGSINSAPRYLVLYGLLEEAFVPLDNFTYDINGPPSQTFVLMNEEVKLYPIQTILLEIKSNWGHPNYTCVYRFKVHGKMAEPGINNVKTGQKLL